MQHFIIKCCIFSFYTIFSLAFTFYHGKTIMENSVEKRKNSTHVIPFIS